MEYIQIPAPDFSFDEIAKDKASEIIRHYLNGNGLTQFVWGGYDEMLDSVINEVLSLDNDSERIVCIIELLNHLTKKVNHYTDNNTHTGDELVRHIKGINRIKYKLYSLASNSTGYNFDKNAFNSDEVTDLERKINAILIKLDEIQLGNEILYDEVHELKNDLQSLKTDVPLGKKRWYQRATGVVVTFAAQKGSEAIFDETLKPLIVDLIHNPEVHKFLGM